MPNGTYGGVRGRRTKVGRKLLRSPPTRFHPPHPITHYTKYGSAHFGKSDRHTHRFTSHLLKAHPPIAPFSYRLAPRAPPQAPMLAIVFYRPSYSHIFISIHCRSACFGKSDRHTHRFTTSLRKVANLCKYLFHRIC